MKWKLGFNLGSVLSREFDVSTLLIILACREGMGGLCIILFHKEESTK